jgi:putative redox protein
MQKRFVEFENERGIALRGDLYLPLLPTGASVLLAHCFTCAANFKAPVRISRALAEQGFAVLAFDFTGLGRSEGEFSDSSFTTNVADLVAAARYLEAEQGAGPAVLVGHSLGGTAVLAAARSIPSARAVVTIAAPSSASHIERLITSARAEIEATGEAVVDIGGRPFRIKKQLLDDISRSDVPGSLSELERPLLILHSPRDTVVSISEASEIFTRAKHPKSFVSLDDADHMLNRDVDAEYAARTIAAWSSRYLPPAEPAASSTGEVRASTGAEGFVTQMEAAGHALVADEPVRLGGDGLGPSPYDLLSAALASCTSMTLQLYARRKGMALDTATVRVSHSRVHAEDCEDCEAGQARIDRFERVIHLSGDLTSEQRRRLAEIAERCPVHRTLESEALIVTRLG